MCPSSWKSYLDDFPFFGSALAHLDPKLELFEVWEFGSWCHWRWWWSTARLSPICAFCLQNFLTTRPDPSRYPTFFASTRPVPSRSQKPLPVGPCPHSSLWPPFIKTICRPLPPFFPRRHNEGVNCSIQKHYTCGFQKDWCSWPFWQHLVKLANCTNLLEIHSYNILGCL